MDFTEDPFRDYRYEDPFNLVDPFADATDSKSKSSGRPNDKISDSFSAFSPLSKAADTSSSFAAFETDDFFVSSRTVEKNNNTDSFGGRQSIPLPSNDPFNKSGRVSAPLVNNLNNNNEQSWAAFRDSTPTGWGDSNDNWATTEAWTDTSINLSASKPTNTQFGTWATSKTKTEKEKKKEKSPKAAGKPFTLNLGRHKNVKAKNTSAQPAVSSAPPVSALEEQQLAWVAAEGKRLEQERRHRREEEDKELQIAMALSMRNQ